MLRKLFLSSTVLFLLLSLCLVLVVEADFLMWSQTYEVTGTDGAFSVVETSDGCYVMACIAGYYYCLLKADAFGNREWHQTYGLVDISWLEVMPVQAGSCSLVAAHDGGYAMVGAFEFGFHYGDFWLLKTDVSGNMEWKKTYGEEKGDKAYALVATSDGGYALAGSTNSSGAGKEDFWLIKTDSLGNMEWNRTYGEEESDRAYALVATSDGGYALTGTKNDDFWLVKTDEFGNMEWNRTYGGAGMDLAHSLVVASDGGYAIAGTWDYEYIYDFETGKEVSRGDFWLVKTDAAGNMEWNRTDGGTEYEWAWSLVATSDGGYALAGSTESFGAGSRDFWLIKTDSLGNMEWNQTYGGTGYEWAYSLVETSDGGYAIAGETTSFGDSQNRKIWLVKTDEYGVVPEYTSFLLPSLLLVATLVIVIYKKKRST